MHAPSAAEIKGGSTVLAGVVVEDKQSHQSVLPFYQHDVYAVRSTSTQHSSSRKVSPVTQLHTYGLSVAAEHDDIRSSLGPCFFCSSHQLCVCGLLVLLGLVVAAVALILSFDSQMDSTAQQQTIV